MILLGLDKKHLSSLNRRHQEETASQYVSRNAAIYDHIYHIGGDLRQKTVIKNLKADL